MFAILRHIGISDQIVQAIKVFVDGQYSKELLTGGITRRCTSTIIVHYCNILCYATIGERKVNKKLRIKKNIN